MVERISPENYFKTKEVNHVPSNNYYYQIYNSDMVKGILIGASLITVGILIGAILIYIARK